MPQRGKATIGRVAALALSAASLATSPVLAQESQPASAPIRVGRGDEAETSAGSLDLLLRLQTVVEELVDRASRSVVAVHGQPYPGAIDPPARADQVLLGTGFVLRGDGLILTSQHVVDSARGLHVVLADGRRLRARLLAADPRADLAVLKVEAGNLAAMELGDVRRVRRGQVVLALGHPSGLITQRQPAVVQGLVSAIARPLPESLGAAEDRYYGDMIQVSAPLSAGHSGGPLIDLRGRVIGVISAVTTRSHESVGVGFAVPLSARTRSVLDGLMQGQPMEYGYLGVRVADRPLKDEICPDGRAAAGDSTSPVRQRPDSPVQSGVVLLYILPDGPAHGAGLQPGDVVFSLDGRPVESADSFIQELGARGPGSAVDIAYLRDGRRQMQRVRLARRLPSPRQERMSSWRLHGATLGALDAAVRAESNLPEGAAVVLVVDAGSPADAAGLSPGDIVVRIDGRPPSPDAVRSASGESLLGLASGNSILIKASK